MRDFVQRHYPALLRTHEAISIFAVSAVQEKLGEDGHRKPRPDSAPVNVAKPLKHCLKLIRAQEARRARENYARAEEMAWMEQLREDERRVAALNRKAAFIVGVILILGMCAAALIWFLRG